MSVTPRLFRRRQAAIEESQRFLEEYYVLTKFPRTFVDQSEHFKCLVEEVLPPPRSGSLQPG